MKFGLNHFTGQLITSGNKVTGQGSKICFVGCQRHMMTRISIQYSESDLHVGAMRSGDCGHFG